MSLVVRCPDCRGASQVESAAVGLLVRCPHCASEFEAVAVIEPATPARPRNPTTTTAPPPPRPERTNRAERPRKRKTKRERELPPEHDHDPHRIPPGPLPVSVLIGLALLPFAIPVLWLVGPALFGEPPVLSIATPIALAISASILCLAVIYTIDWTPATRVKGVLMLVCMTYFAAMNLYFLKKEMVDRVKKITGTEEGADWSTFKRNHGDYEIKMPGRPKKGDKPLLPPFELEYYSSTHIVPFQGPYVFTAGAAEIGLIPNPVPGSDEWFEAFKNRLKQDLGGEWKSDRVTHKDAEGRQFVIVFPEGRVRVIQIYVINGFLYYLAAEGDALDPDEDLARVFFDSFNCRARN